MGHIYSLELVETMCSEGCGRRWRVYINRTNSTNNKIEPVTMITDETLVDAVDRATN